MSDKFSPDTKQDVKEYSRIIRKQAELLANKADRNELDANGAEALEFSSRLRDEFNISSGTDIALVQHIADTASENDMPEVAEDMKTLLPFFKALESDVSETFSKMKPGSFDGEEVINVLQNAAASHKHLLNKR